VISGKDFASYMQAEEKACHLVYKWKILKGILN
jgi:hypothetical protein